MTRRWKRKPKNSYGKWEGQVVCGTSKIIRIEVQNQEINEKFKTVFYVESKMHPQGRMCVIWGRTTFSVGDEINMTGRISEGVFLVWSYLYKKCEKPESEVKEAIK